ncbi:MAG: SpoVA/SpoVAEb family sporulation membrane protein [Oscillospiraceae bacterium]|jgi:stage V sporulation protein AC|nr:SpoVA/SpoVAEb family sporulation membrane protein [Oscillospiraceae bacterium]
MPKETFTMTNSQYKAYIDTAAPKSSTGVNMLKAFLVGGAICAAGQLLFEYYSSLWVETVAATALSSTLIAIGVILTAFGVYDKLASVGMAGTLVPITGFANAMASQTIEFKAEGLVSGATAKMFVIAGPVIVFGLAASVIYGIILVVTGLV